MCDRRSGAVLPEGAGGLTRGGVRVVVTLGAASRRLLRKPVGAEGGPRVPEYKSPGVYIEEEPVGSQPIEGVSTAVAAFVGLAAKGNYNEPIQITNWTQFTDNFGGFVDGLYLAHAVYAYFLNGGTICYVVRIGAPAETTPAALPGGKRGAGTAGVAAGARVSLDGFLVAAKEGATGNLLVEVVNAEPAPDGGDPPEDAFVLVVRSGDQELERHPVSAKRSSRNYVVTAVRRQSELVVVEEAVPSGAQARPANQAVQVPPAPEAAAGPAGLGPDVYVGNVGDRTGFAGLEAIDNVTMLAVPDLLGAFEQGALTEDQVKGVQVAMIAHCELMGNRIALIDPLPDLNPQQVYEWRRNKAGYDSKYAAMYYPWIKVMDPVTGDGRLVPPSGAMAGVWARNDATRGVHKAPANEVVRGAVDLAVNLTKAENALLNPEGVNCIRAFPGRGIRVWGARTLSSEASWRYVNVRRLFNYLEESILIGTQWVVFEPNDDALWARIRRTISAFLISEWRRGALFGLTPDEAFYVRCDRETNPADQIDLGRVICEIGVAPVKPAEFVIFRLAQFSGGTSLVDE